MGRIEALPAPTYFSNEIPSIVKWRKQHGPIITYLEQRKAPLKILGRGKTATCEEANLEHRYQTRTSEKWHVEVCPDRNISVINTPRLSQAEINDVAEYLTIHQQLYVPAGEEEKHANAVNFLSRNWKEIRRKLYPIEPAGNVEPYCFSEVLVDKQTTERADFIGFGPDGRLFVFEFKKKWDTYTQAAEYAKKIGNIFSDFNLEITPYMAWYSDAKPNKLHIQAPEKVHMSAGTQMDYYIKNRKPKIIAGQPSSSYHEFDLFATDFKDQLRKIS